MGFISRQQKTALMSRFLLNHSLFCSVRLSVFPDVHTILGFVKPIFKKENRHCQSRHYAKTFLI